MKTISLLDGVFARTINYRYRYVLEPDRQEGAINRRHVKVGSRSLNPCSRNFWRDKKLLATKQSCVDGGST